MTSSPADVELTGIVEPPPGRLRRTPMVALRVRDTRRNTSATIRLKLESFGATGSVKDRTALGLLRALHRQLPLMPGDVVVESTSGNLGIAMARLLALMSCRFVAVIDPNTPPSARDRLLELGAEVHDVRDPDGHGGYLLSRLRAVEGLCAANPHFRWSNQYQNPANPEIHAATTGPELVQQAPDLDAVYVAVSTGGTLAGISRHLRARRPGARTVAVDAEGSIALGGVAARRLLSGIGASRPSSFLTPDTQHAVIRVADAASFGICRAVRAQTGLALGGSGGSVLMACLGEALGGARSPRFPVCLIADGGRNYLTSFYDDEWLAAKAMLAPVLREEAEINSRFVFELDPRQLLETGEQNDA